MKPLKNILFLLITTIFMACGSAPINTSSNQQEEPVIIANEELQYEIIILDIGFNNYLNTIAQPEGYYDQSFMETRNRVFVANWNNRAQNPTQYDASIYENIIDYQPNINYGYEVNYKLFNYFLFAQRKYKMTLGFGTARLN
ncbi:hypothetical protein OD91_1161 [Lutibacter sp. Hel_I_33_5]|uniref:DUF6146 family protein n=1 Tax=Lutibacter sp. Hel_I_33_5 TaxID=1566289 RepID=UPI00119D43DA|nr:DUF6146 family protein [Lutibacter sp. Hel_I_33_5]TVZ55888.1 hypothetical protein OD91_1161 [Lutibacter sp. Hel_I_33_5]